MQKRKEGIKMQRVPKCLICKYYLKDFTCKAFPEKIPYDIISERKEHNKVVKGQKDDFVFELKES